MDIKKEACFGSVEEAVEYIVALKKGEYSVKIADKELKEIKRDDELSEALADLPADVFVSLDISGCSALKRIDDCAFLSCQNLSGIEFPEGLEWIGRSVFCPYDGTGLDYVEIPKSVRHIGCDTFYDVPEIQFREVFFWSRRPMETVTVKEPDDRYCADGIPLSYVVSYHDEGADLLTGGNACFSYYDWDFYSD